MSYEKNLARVKALLRRVAEAGAEPDASVLRDQIDGLQIRGGSKTMVELEVDVRAPRIPRADGPLPISAVVVDPAGVEIGELIVWVTAGYVSQLEFAWWGDVPPADLPAADMVKLISVTSG